MASRRRYDVVADILALIAQRNHDARALVGAIFEDPDRPGTHQVGWITEDGFWIALERTERAGREEFAGHKDHLAKDRSADYGRLGVDLRRLSLPMLGMIRTGMFAIAPTEMSFDCNTMQPTFCVDAVASTDHGAPVSLRCAVPDITMSAIQRHTEHHRLASLAITEALPLEHMDVCVITTGEQEAASVDPPEATPAMLGMLRAQSEADMYTKGCVGLASLAHRINAPKDVWAAAAELGSQEEDIVMRAITACATTPNITVDMFSKTLSHIHDRNAAIVSAFNRPPPPAEPVPPPSRFIR